MKTRHAIVFRAAVLIAAVGIAGTAAADKPQEVVDNATQAIKDMGADPKMAWFRENVMKSKGVVVIPKYGKGGLIVGGAGGRGVAMTRGGRSWSHPSFVTLSALTLGLQAGGEGGELMLLIMSKKGFDAILKDKFNLGADASVAAGPATAGAKTPIADILVFSRTKGVFGGLTVDGAKLAVKEDWNREYYQNEKVQPVDILVTRNQVNDAAEQLRVTMAAVGGR
jgi:lipid-binding SYLF domain-containing protein